MTPLDSAMLVGAPRVKEAGTRISTEIAFAKPEEYPVRVTDLTTLVCVHSK